MEHWSTVLEIAPRDWSAMKNWKRALVGPGTGAYAEVVADPGANAAANDEIEVPFVGVGDVAGNEGDESPRPKMLNFDLLGRVVLVCLEGLGVVGVLGLDCPL